MHPVSCRNTYYDVIDLVNNRMAINTNTWISGNITFLWNKKNLNQCLRWHILRSYRFIAELNFKVYFEGNSVAQPQELLQTKKLIKGEKTPVKELVEEIAKAHKGKP